MLPDEMEAEKNRRIILAQANTIDLLENNVHNQWRYRVLENRT